MKKLLILAALIAATSLTVNAKNYVAFKKPQSGGADTKEVYQDGKAMQISTKTNSVVVLCIEKTEIGGAEMISLASVSLVEGTPEVTFDPERITCTAFDGKKDVMFGVHNPENYKLTQEKKAKNAKLFASFGIALSAKSATSSALNTMSNTNNFKDQMASINQSANECLFITSLSVAEVNETAGKVILFPKKGKVGKFESVKISVPVGDEVHEFVFAGSIVKI